MTNVYEYEHPIINNQLAISGDNPTPRKFPTLQSWYNVINDYEFKSRCPIILKNSHRNRHFTFACHLKNCEFKVLLSYSGTGSNVTPPMTSGPRVNTNHSTTTAITRNDKIEDKDNNNIRSEHMEKSNQSHKDSTNNNNDLLAGANDVLDHTALAGLDDVDINMNKNDKLQKDNNNHNTAEDLDRHIRKYTEADANNNDVSVSDAIAAAVAAVQNNNSNNNNSNNNSSHNDSNRDSNMSIKNEKTEKQDHTNNTINEDDTNSLLEPSITFADEEPIMGPFIVTKIYPYHNHPLEENMSLDKFVLTKVPKILQNDLNFDMTLEELYRKGNNSMNKFKVSQFVEGSGLLDIVKQRYHLTDDDINKKFISLISRRVTTYKARFVLRKKKHGDYQLNDENNPSHNTIDTHTNNQSTVIDSNNNVLPNNPNRILDSHSQPHHIQQQQQQQPQHQQYNSNMLKQNKDIIIHNNNNNNNGNNNNNNETDKLHDVLLGDSHVMDLSNQRVANQDAKDAQATAQAVINDVINLKHVMGDDSNGNDLERYSKRSKHEIMKNMNTSIDETLNLDDIHDDKLPHEVAEQLRLLSSHFKEVEAAQAALNPNQNHNNPHQDDLNDTNNQSGLKYDEDDEEEEDSHAHAHAHADDEDVNVQVGHHLQNKAHIQDENIQPELRDQ